MRYFIRINRDGIHCHGDKGPAAFYWWDTKNREYGESHKTLKLTNAVLVMQREHPDARAFLWADGIEEVSDSEAQEQYWETYGA